MSNILDTIPLGEEVEIRGPTGEIQYHGSSTFTISSKIYHFPRINLILGGSGITPGFALLSHSLNTPNDTTQFRVIDANKTQNDILLHDELDGLEKKSKGRLKVTHVLSHPEEGWEGRRGHVDAGVLREGLFGPGEGTGVFLCGPPGLIQKAVLPGLREWGFREDESVFGF